jgi:cytochrome c-type biogenesis protein CcmH/NrfF
MTTLPLWIWVVGVAVLGIVLAYGILRNRTRSLHDEQSPMKQPRSCTGRRIVPIETA